MVVNILIIGLMVVVRVVVVIWSIPTTMLFARGTLFGYSKRDLIHLPNHKLEIRHNPDMPSNYRGAQGFQVRAVDKE